MSIPVVDPFDVVADKAMPTLEAALDPAVVEAQFNRKLERLTGPNGTLALHRIQVVRHKPGRRCVIQYDLSIDRPRTATQRTTLIGKVRAGRFGKSGYRMLQKLWEAGFQDDSSDGISVPEPLGTVGRLQMWLQRKVPGQLATAILPTTKGPALGARIVEAVCKLHRSSVEVTAHHSLDKELRILHERLALVYQFDGRLRRRIHDLLRACDELGTTIPSLSVHPIHRDFYADQVIVDKKRIYLLDFDLCCRGDPAVDIGNFVAHLTEQSLREHGSAELLKPVEESMEQRFLELAGPERQPAVSVYRLLTLVRHVYLSTVIPGRRDVTVPLIELCEACFAKARWEASPVE